MPPASQPAFPPPLLPGYPVAAAALRPGGRPWAPIGAALLLGGLAATLPFSYAVALLLAAAVVPLALARPIVALGLAVAAIPLSSEWNMNVGGLNLTLMEPAVGLALLAWLGAGLRRQRAPRLWPSALLGVLVLVLALFVLSALGATAPGPSIKDTIKWVELLIVFVLTVDLARDTAAARLLLLALLGATALEAAYGIVQFLLGRGPAFFAIGPFMRAHGHFGQPNPFAGYLGTALPLALAIGWATGREPADRADDPRPRGDRQWRRPAPGPWALDDLLHWASQPAVLGRAARLAAAVITAAAILSFSRGAWLGSIAAVALMLAVASARSRRLLVPITLVLVMLGALGTLNLLPPAIAERLSIIGEYFGPFDVRHVEVTPQNWSLVERMAHWQAAWYMFLDRPWLGMGPGNYAAMYDQYYLPGWTDPLGHAHNYYLNLAAETGLFGLLGFLLALGLGFRAAARGLRGADAFWRTLALGSVGALAAIALHSLFDNLFVHGVSVQVGVLLGLAWVAAERARVAPNDPTSTSRPAARASQPARG